MVTRDELWNLLGRRPFHPFRLTLVGGGTLDVTRPNQGVVSAREFIVGTPDEHFRWIRLDRIERIDAFEIRQRA